MINSMIKGFPLISKNTVSWLATKKAVIPPFAPPEKKNKRGNNMSPIMTRAIQKTVGRLLNLFTANRVKVREKNSPNI
jgi:hypothetical protein